MAKITRPYRIVWANMHGTHSRAYYWDGKIQLRITRHLTWTGHHPTIGGEKVFVFRSLLLKSWYVGVDDATKRYSFERLGPYDDMATALAMMKLHADPL